ncbi:MAG: lanthionine synthetase, partial [Lactobacillus iners]|nr:lanthionine synthetase [Lactobacillus iners]
KQIADTIISRYHSGEFDNQEEYEGRLGLIKGWAGPVIFLWKLGTLINDLHYRSEAIIILDKIVATGIINTEQGSALSDKSKGMVRILPYLDTGFAGLSLV